MQTAPDLVAGHLKQVIGSPEEYSKNFQKNYFPTDNDITIPCGKRQSDIDLQGALDEMDLSQGNGHPNQNRVKVADTGDQYMPIGALNQFSQEFRFKARVVKKPPLRQYTNQKGSGQIMGIDLIDREGTMIQATLFNEMAEKWYPKIEENKVYIFANGKVGLSNKRFTSIKNDYSLTFGLETEI